MIKEEFDKILPCDCGAFPVIDDIGTNGLLIDCHECGKFCTRDNYEECIEDWNEMVSDEEN